MELNPFSEAIKTVLRKMQSMLIAVLNTIKKELRAYTEDKALAVKLFLALITTPFIFFCPYFKDIRCLYPLFVVSCVFYTSVCHKCEAYLIKQLREEEVAVEQEEIRHEQILIMDHYHVTSRGL